MKIINILKLFLIPFLIIYAAYSAGATETRPAEYLVTINGIPMYSSSAEIVLQRVKDKKNGVLVYDRVKNSHGINIGKKRRYYD